MSRLTHPPEGSSEFEVQRLLPADRDVSKLVRATVRALNLRLLQLARPEEMFFCRHLPPAYIRHYLMHQEHLSAVRFLSHLAARTHAALHKEEPAEGTEAVAPPPRRWIVFCRSSPILLALDSLRAVLADMLPHVALSCFDMSALEAGLKAVDAPKRAADLAPPPDGAAVPAADKTVMYLCVAELGRYATAELNFKRDLLREFHERHPDAMVVMLLHFPAHRQLGSLYDGSCCLLNVVVLCCLVCLFVFGRSLLHAAIFLNQWEYLYVDSFGVDLAKKETKADARSWLATAFGLKDCYSPRDVQTDLDSLFDELLHECITDLPFTPLFPQMIKQFDLAPQAQRLYLHGLPLNARVAAIKALIVAHPSLKPSLLTGFADIWTTSLLHTVVERACNAIKRGEHADSLLSHVSSSLRLLLRAMVMKLLFYLLRNFAISRIVAIVRAPCIRVRFLRFVLTVCVRRPALATTSSCGASWR